MSFGNDTWFFVCDLELAASATDSKIYLDLEVLHHVSDEEYQFRNVLSWRKMREFWTFFILQWYG